MEKACYRKLHKYKYQLTRPYQVDVGIKGLSIDIGVLGLKEDGMLIINKGYAWDGPSGPTIDTFNFMRGSLVHDALYQLIRMELIDLSFKDHADRLLQKMCKKDGMSPFRAWYVYLAVKWFGGSSCKPGSQEADKEYCVPVDK